MHSAINSDRLKFILQALGRAARVIFCYQLQHVTIRLVPCDVLFYGNTMIFFSSYDPLLSAAAV